MNKILLFLLVILLIPGAAAQKQGHMKLLAVKDTSSGYAGSIADLYLEISPGTGRVFIETYPLSKMDTQISTRFAKEIACNLIKADCDEYDFFYVIQSESAIIGGPSAGAAIAVLTAAMLKDIPINESIAMTGTINSGGLIGPVSGLKAKIEIAKDSGLKRVIVPAGEIVYTEDDNTTIDLGEHSKNLSIEVVEAADLAEAMYYFTGINFAGPDKEISVSEEYEEIMKMLAERLCNRTFELSELVGKNKNLLSKNDSELIDQAVNLSKKGSDAFAIGSYYSSASYCFGANVLYRQIDLEQKSLSEEIVEEEIRELDEKVEQKEIKTIADLESYMIVKDRLDEAEAYLKQLNESKDSRANIRNLARAIERVYSARSWSWFFTMGGVEFIFDDESLKDGCMKKVSEAEERYQYANMFFPGQFAETRKEIDDTEKDLENGDYELCIFSASKAKAEVDVVLSSIGVREEQVEGLLDNKLRIVKRVIVQQQEKGMFPILGYSYYEYANSLKKTDKYSAMLYAEYSLELSNLDMYFKQKKEKEMHIDNGTIGLILVFISGVIFGVVATLAYKKLTRKKKISRKDYKTHAKHS